MDTNLKPQALRPRPARAAVTRPPRILVVDDEVSVRALCVRMLRPRYEVVECSAATQALDLLATVDLVLTDLEMPDMNGIALIERLRKSHPDLPVFLMTGRQVGDSCCVRARSMGIPVLPKPFSQADILAFLETPATVAG